MIFPSLNKLYRSILVSSCLLFASQVVAQPVVCGSSATTCHEIHDRLAYNQTHYTEIARTRSVQYVPIVFHLVGNDDGSHRASTAQVLDMVCMLNRIYLDQEIQFYLKAPVVNFINNTSLNNNTIAYSSEALRNWKIPNAINVFVTKTISSGVNISGYYQGPAGASGNDYIVVAQNHVYSPNVLPHEIGHFFSLLHPFYGWENNHWTAAQGNPVGINAPSDPNLFPSSIATEWQNGSNCQTAGDRICDTPPDYLFALNSNQVGCSEWSVPVRDPNNQVVNPQEDNIMSYFPNCGDYVFTAQQKEAIANDLFNSSVRAYIRQDQVPNTTPINDIPDLIAPQDGTNINAGTSAVLSWFPVIEAQYYAVEIDTNQGFASPNKQTQVIGANIPNAIFSDLIPNTQYYWRVRPFTEYITCTGYSDQRSFYTGTVATRNIEALSDWAITPNPVTDNHISLSIESERAMKTTVTIHNINGAKITSVKKEIPNGGSTLLLNDVPLTSGVYFISIQEGGNTETKRFIKY